MARFIRRLQRLTLVKCVFYCLLLLSLYLAASTMTEQISAPETETRAVSRTPSNLTTVSPPLASPPDFTPNIIPTRLFHEEIELSQDERSQLFPVGQILLVNGEGAGAQWIRINIPKGRSGHIGQQFSLNQNSFKALKKYCPKGFEPNPDHKDLDIVRHCSQNKYRFPYEIQIWAYKEEELCPGHLYGFYNEMLLIVDAIVDGRQCHGSVGGEPFNYIRRKRLSSSLSELYNYTKGLVSVECGGGVPTYRFRNAGESYLTEWYSNIVARNGVDVQYVKRSFLTFTVAITRYEYSNLYHTICEAYNVFLVTRFFQKHPKSIQVLLVDGHPSSALDTIWISMFKTAQRIGRLRHTFYIKELAWAPPGHQSIVLDTDRDDLPMVDEFASHILNMFAIRLNSKPLACSALIVTFILRHNFTFSLRNVGGEVDRQITNEEELLAAIRARYRNFKVDGQQMERLSVRDQLAAVYSTDILIGMHGAGLTHALFLPSHAGVIELFPKHWSQARDHFKAIAKWRGLHYQSWTNDNNTNVVNPGATFPLTYIPVNTMLDLIEQMRQKICPRDE